MASSRDTATPQLPSDTDQRNPANQHPSILWDPSLRLNLDLCSKNDVSRQPASHAVVRPTRNYHPDIWGDYFLKYGSEEDTSSMVSAGSLDRDIKKLVAEVKVMLADDANYNFSEKLNLIDQVQRFGVAYHFENEIDEQLARLNDIHLEFSDSSNDLHTIALIFRLTRQHGYNVKSEVFRKFQDGCGRFKDSLVQDVRGLLGLYEASHMMIHGEDILEEALAFTTTHLRCLVDEEQPSPFLVKLAKHALDQPLRRAYPRLQAYHYLVIYREDASRNEVIYSLAKLDFHCLQKLHQKEVSHVVRWCKDLDVARKFPFARDRPVENYFWILGTYFEPKYSFLRKFLAKMFMMATILDDIYDAFGTLDELQRFTQALHRWDIGALEGLPECMQHYYKFLLEVYGEIEEELVNRGHLYRLHYAKESMKIQARTYLAEVKWRQEKYVPTIEEYSDVAAVSIALPMLVMQSLVGMDDDVTEDTCEWLSSYPKILQSTSVACRYVDDVRGHKFEEMRDHVVSSIGCLIKQYGYTEQEAEEELMKRVFNLWKDINEASLRPFAVPMPVLVLILNFMRTASVIYEGADNYTNSSTKLKHYVTALLIDRLPL